MWQGKGFHFKVSNEDHVLIQSFFRKYQGLNMSGTFRELILDYVIQETSKREGNK